jgi:hypothetical protein
MKIFPQILCRVAGLPFDELAKLNCSVAFCELLETQSFLETDFERCKSELLTDLKSFDATFSAFPMIRKMKKLIYKNRILNVDITQNEFSFFNKILIYNDLWNQKKKGAKILETQLVIEDLRIKTELQRLSKNPNFLNALPLSSIILAKSLKNYWNKNPKDFRKKELQTEQTVMQYLARMAAKTSPFSSFTKVSSHNFQAESISVSYNNFLLQILETLFIANENIFKYLKIRINSTLEKGDLEYRFLVNVQNIESFQRVEIQPILELIETYFIDNERFVILELINKIGEEVEAETADLLDFVEELVGIGFLQIDFDFHGNMENWLGKVRNFVVQTPVFDDFDVEFFEYLERQLVDFKNAKIWERIAILENTQGRIQVFLDKYGFNKDLTEILSPEQLMYEDVKMAESSSFEAKGIESLVFSLHELLEKINFIQGKERLQIAHFFNNFYDENAIVPLLDFYESYYKIGKKIKETEIPTIQAEAKLLENWAKAVGEMVLEKYEMNTVLELEISDFDKINKRLNIQSKPLKGLSLACFAQMYSEGNELKAVLNGVTLGYGKMTGRFLKLMPQAFTADLRKFNAALGKEILMAENVDASFFNANIHPPLLEYEISMPKSQNQLSENRQLKVADLAIRKVNNEIVLWHLKLKKAVQVLDLGIQTPKGRSPLYQLLMNFSPNIPDLQYLKEAIEAVIPQNGKNNMVFPRVIFKKWVIFRKIWILQDWEILDRIKEETELLRLQVLMGLLKENKIQSKFYIKTIKSTQKEERNRKGNKPIYIDIDNVILRNYLLKRIDSKNYSFELSEMWPGYENLIEIKNRPFYFENILQWYSYE